MPSRYSIDTSAILDAWVRHYPSDVFPAVWARLDEMIATGSLIATEEVLVELEKKADDVHKWAKARGEMFIPIDTAIQVGVSTILASHPRLVDSRKNRSRADPFVIALARLKSYSVVTAEGPTGKLEKPNIPDVCGALSVPCFNLVDMFRQQGWKI